MKRYKTITILLIVCILSTGLIGCGKKVGELKEPYTITEECKKASPTSGICQIDDVVLNVNMQTVVKDFMENLSEGRDADVYGFETYNAQMLVSAGYSSKYTITKNGTEYIDVYFWNNTKETTTLEKCYVVSIAPYGPATSFFWLGGGMNFDTTTFSWDSVVEKLEDGGFVTGVTDPRSPSANYGVAAYEDKSESTNFRFYLTINYDQTFVIEEWYEQTVFNSRTFMQSVTYILTFDKDSHQCLSVESQGFQTVEMQH